MTANKAKKYRVLSIIGPGILVAATGVGAGDLATGAITGSKLGVAVLWAVVVGAGMKLLLNEGLARWQLATGSTFLEGSVRHFGRPAQWLFLAYLLLWSFFVGSALMSACGVTAHGILPLSDPQTDGILCRLLRTDPGPQTDKVFYGLLHSAAAVALVKLGGYRLFGKVMGACIAVMFVVVILTAVLLKPSWAELGAGLVLPTIPQMQGEGLPWTIALVGGVGGTLTILCYGYWIREEGRQEAEDLPVCRIDLATGYAMTALFGMAMVVVGSTIRVSGGGATLIVDLAGQLETAVGPAARWAFLLGAWGAVFSSLLGVWQSVPYLFADFRGLLRNRTAPSSERTIETRSPPYQIYLFALATIPAAGLWTSFQQVQKLYAIIGAMFIPMLALALLLLNGRSALVGRRHRNSLLVTLLLVGTLAFFLLFASVQVYSKLFQ